MSCKIHLDNYSSIYYPGNEIRGRVECYLNEQTTVRGIKIRLKCKEHNEWTGTETYTDPVTKKQETRHITLTGDHDILYLEQMLFGSNSGSNTLGSGRHFYPFSFTLPSNIPSSFNGPHGHVAYKLKAVVDRPMWFDYEDQMHFKVEAPIDFNKMSTELQEPVSYSDDKTICCFCCQGGEITMNVELPKLGFVPGEPINCTVHVTNMSNRNVDNLGVKFKKTVKYRVNSPHSETREDEEHLISYRDHGVGAHGEHTYDLSLDIPSYVVVPNFSQCHLFEVDYLLQFSCHMPSCVLDLDINIYNLTLGHVPFREPGQVGFATPLPPGVEVPPPGYPPPMPPPANGFGFAEVPSAPPAFAAPGGNPTAPSAPMEKKDLDLPPSYYEAQQQNVPTYQEYQEKA